MPDTAPEPSGDEPRPDVLETAIAQLTEIAGSLQQLLDVRVARARVEVREKVFRALGQVMFWTFLLVLNGLAGFYVLRGLAGLLTRLLGNNPWAGDLAAGGAVLLIALSAGLAFRASLRRANLRHMREKFSGDSASQAEAE